MNESDSEIAPPIRSAKSLPLDGPARRKGQDLRPHLVLVTNEYGDHHVGGLGTYVEILLNYLQSGGFHWFSDFTVITCEGRDDSVDVCTGAFGETIAKLPVPFHLQQSVSTGFREYATHLHAVMPHLPLNDEDCLLLANDLNCGYVADELASRSSGNHHLIYVTHLLRGLVSLNGYDGEHFSKFVEQAQKQSQNPQVAAQLGPYFVEQSLLRKADSVLFVSNYMRWYVRERMEVTPKHDAVVEHYLPPLPVEKKTYLSNPINIAFAGRLEVQKGVLDLIEHADLLLEVFPDATLHLFGDGSLRPVLEWRTRGMGKRVRMRGFVDRDEMLKQLSEVDVMLMPSIYEPLGFAALEAMAIGVPLISSNVGGLGDVTEWLPDGMRLCPVIGRHPLYKSMKNIGRVNTRDDFRRTAQFVARHPDVVRRVAEEGKEIARTKYGAERYRREMDAFFEDVFRIQGSWAI